MESLILCLLCILHAALFADYFQNQVFLKILSGISSVLNSLESDQAQHTVIPDLGPNCL